MLLVGECDTVQGLTCSCEGTLFLRLSSTSAQFGVQGLDLLLPLLLRKRWEVIGGVGGGAL